MVYCLSPALAPPLPIPPEHLRLRVHGASDLASFLSVGQQCSHDLLIALESIGRPLSSFQSILDFGCGCARTLRFLTPHTSSAHIYGTDIDHEAIRWCQQHLPVAYFMINDALPPLACADASFDLIYAISVFTHLDQASQFCWLYELQRVCKPGGIVLLTTHGEQVINQLPEPLAAYAWEQGFFVIQADGWKGTFPSWYQDTVQTPEYINRQFGRYFCVLNIIPSGMNHHQDLVVLQRTNDRLALPPPPLPVWARMRELEQQIGALQALVARKDAHIEQLEHLLHMIERGYVLRLLNFLRQALPI